MFLVFPGYNYSFPTLLMAQCFFCCQGITNVFKDRSSEWHPKSFSGAESAVSFQELDISCCHNQTHQEIKPYIFLKLDMKKRKKKNHKEHPSITITLNTLSCFMLLRGIESLKVPPSHFDSECQHLRKQFFFISNNYSCSSTEDRMPS